jgi:hypothetical protein
MRKLFLCFLFSPLVVLAQQTTSEEDQIKAIILKTFSAMKSVDSVALKSCFTPTALLQISQVNPERNVVREVPVAKFIQNVMSRKPGELDERVLSWGPILVDKEIAMAWVPYEFYLNGKFTHKGVDVFLFHKSQNEFKIQTLMYTMQR